MSALVAGATVIPVSRVDVPHEFEEYGGDRARMINGTLRVTVKGTKNVFDITTRLLTAAEQTTILAALAATPPIAFTGDITGAMNCFVKLRGSERVAIRGAVKFRLRFTLSQQ